MNNNKILEIIKKEHHINNEQLASDINVSVDTICCWNENIVKITDGYFEVIESKY